MTSHCMHLLDTVHQTKILCTEADNMKLRVCQCTPGISSLISFWSSTEQSLFNSNWYGPQLVLCMCCSLWDTLSGSILHVILVTFTECTCIGLHHVVYHICLHSLSSADIDECASSAYCPDNSSCANQPGSFECFCDRGYIMRNGLCAGEVHTPAPPPGSHTYLYVTLVFRCWWMCGQPLSLWGPEMCQHWRRLPVWLLPRVHEGWHGHVHRWEAHMSTSGTWILQMSNVRCDHVCPCTYATTMHEYCSRPPSVRSDRVWQVCR